MKLVSQNFFLFYNSVYEADESEVGPVFTTQFLLVRHLELMSLNFFLFLQLSL